MPADRASPVPEDVVERTEPALVDHHCHAVTSHDLELPEFASLLTESTRPATAGTSHVDAPLGLAVRRWCAPVLDGEPGMPMTAYHDRRTALGATEVNRRLLLAAGLDALLVDTGHEPSDATSLDDLATLSGADVHEIVRIEQVAEEVLATAPDVRGFTDAFEAALRARTARAVGLKSVAAYRGGLALPPAPRRPAVDAAVERVLTRAGGAIRLDDQPLVRHCLEVAGDVAAESALPVQFHTGFGDADLQLDQSNPALLTPLLREYDRRGVAVVLLHCYPFQREAGYLASVFPGVHLDVGLAIPHLGASSHRVLAESLELAPFAKHLFSSDAFGLAELHLVAASLFRRSLHRVLDDWVASGDCTATDARLDRGRPRCGQCPPDLPDRP